MAVAGTPSSTPDGADADPVAIRMRVRGTVQGVGFRPYVHRLATELGLDGWVLNDVHGVEVHVEGTARSVDAMVARLPCELPPAAAIDTLETGDASVEGAGRFEIRRSAEDGAPTARISPDLPVCDDCLRELADPSDLRAEYPYITCTNCGPRYSIITGLPYDRPRTTMAEWPLCDACAAEYEDPADRRFHAQPVACPECGPTYRLLDGDGVDAGIASGPPAIREAARRLADGEILAIKGIGGYHLACDARRADAVERLRERKFRKEKPFAVMVPSVEDADAVVELGPVHRELLTGPARPIVLAPARVELDGVAPGMADLGLMLPYAPVHVMLFAAGAPQVLVLTSANRSSEPIAYEDDDAITRLAGIADGFLVGDRPIHRRVDDSVATVRNGRPFVVRRSRGLAPAPVATLATRRPILAVGADLKNAVALAVNGDVVLSPHVGDLGDLAADRAFRETIDDLLEMHRVDRRELVVAHDLHPEYVSTRAALELEAAAHVSVQHHEAHIASVLLETGELDVPVVGLALDGTGWGRDGTIQGGEILVGSVARGFRRFGSLAPVSMPGGDAAARHPVQAAAAYLEIDPEILAEAPFGFPARFTRARAMVERGLRCTGTTSAGRLFDAASAVCGFTREASYEGQAAIELEQIARGAGDVDRIGRDPATAGVRAASRLLDGRLTLAAMVASRRAGVSAASVALAFHAGLAEGLASSARAAAISSGATRVVLSGGVWQNALLLEAFTRVVGHGLDVRVPERIPVNDGGIAAGQIAIAAALDARL